MPKSILTKTLFSPAKINLFLHITGKRADGYHNLQTVFRLLDWGDTLDFTVSETIFNTEQVLWLQCFDSASGSAHESPIRLIGDNLPTPKLADNLIYQASIALLNEAKRLARLPNNLPVIDIHLCKRIPTGAGLGGGSSNAATTLLALNELWELELNVKELSKIGATLGADVPIFAVGHDAVAEGIGDVLHPVELPKQQFLLLLPDAHVATASIFSHHQLQRDCPKLAVTTIMGQQADYLYALNPPYSNIFESIVVEHYQPIQEAMNYLHKLEGICHSNARLTGTGACVFLPFERTYLAEVQNYLDSNPIPCRFVMTQSVG